MAPLSPSITTPCILSKLPKKWQRFQADIDGVMNGRHFFLFLTKNPIAMKGMNHGILILFPYFLRRETSKYTVKMQQTALTYGFRNGA